MCSFFPLFGQASIQDRLIYKTDLYTRQTYIQDRLIYKTDIYTAVVLLVAVVLFSSIHGAEHACRGSTSVCFTHDFPYNTQNKVSQLQAAAVIRERLMCRHAVAKVRLLFESGFYSRAALYKTVGYLLFFGTTGPFPQLPHKTQFKKE